MTLVQGADEVPEAVEIDWIQLTGVEELIQGELPPPAVELSASFGRLFNSPTFHPLEVRPSTQFAPLLGDVDGNGTIDLVAQWVDKGRHRRLARRVWRRFRRIFIRVCEDGANTEGVVTHKRWRYQ